MKTSPATAALPAILLITTLASTSPPALAQSDAFFSSGTRGDDQHTTYSTGSQGVPAGGTRTTVPQFIKRPGVLGNIDVAPLPTTLIGVGRARLSPMPVGGANKYGLPPTSMDSFVYEAGGNAEDIYGDEGIYDIPPYFEFTKPHRIEAGIHGIRRAGLTTLHGSYMPDAWGGDEWVDGPEFSFSGSGPNVGGAGGGSGAYNPRNNPPRLPNLGPAGGGVQPPASTGQPPSGTRPRTSPTSLIPSGIRRLIPPSLIPSSFGTWF